jgi:glycine cleavage system H protein
VRVREGAIDGVPRGPRIRKEHEWVREEATGRVRIGITDYAQDALGDVVYVDVPEIGPT